jgi:hypothetical protein
MTQSNKPTNTLSILQEAVDNDGLIVKLAQAVIDGNEYGPDVYIALRKVKDEIDSALKMIDSNVQHELTGRDEGHHMYGQVIRLKNGPSRWKYTDPEYMRVKNNLKRMEEQRKQAYQLSKSSDGIELLDPDTGELLPLAEKIEGRTIIEMRKS